MIKHNGGFRINVSSCNVFQSDKNTNMCLYVPSHIVHLKHSNNGTVKIAVEMIS